MYQLLTAFITAIAAVFLPKKKSFITTCDELMEKMPANRYDELCEFAIGGDGEGDETFWKTSMGMRGLGRRLAISLICMRIVQAHRKEKRINKEDAHFILSKLVRQVIYSVVALPEAAVCGLLTDSRHIAARESLRFYCELVLRTNVLCVTNSAPMCLLRLPDLL